MKTKMQTSLLVKCSLACALLASGEAWCQQQAGSGVEALTNEAWTPITAPIDGMSDRRAAEKAWGGDSQRFLVWQEVWARQFRERGAEYFETHDDDPRFAPWFLDTLQNAPRYWAEPAQAAASFVSYLARGSACVATFDEPAEAAWERSYLSLRARYLADATVTDKQKAEFKKNELDRKVGRVEEKIARSTGDLGAHFEHSAPLFRQYVTDALDLANASGSRSWLLETGIPSFASHDPALEKEVLAAMKLSRNGNARQAALDQEALLSRLRDQPLHLKLAGLDGGEIDAEKFRGKVVLVDFWNFHCGSCFAHMPQFERLYRKYHDAGFELIAVCVVGYQGQGVDKVAERAKLTETERAKDIAITRRYELTYPCAELEPGYDSNGSLDEQNSTLSYFGGPAGGSVFLFDQQGRLVTTDLGGQWLEYEIRRLLGLPAEQTGK